jgi:hypothetical protein
MSTQSQVERDVLHTVQVRDPNGHRTVFLEGLKSSTAVSEIRARAMSELRLTPEVDWNVRQDSSGRLLQEDQRLGEIADFETQITLTMQPDAGLG